MGVPEVLLIKGELEAPVRRDVEAQGNVQVVRGHAQQPRDEGLVRAVAHAGGGEGAVEMQGRLHRLVPQQGPGHAADAHRPGGVGAGGAYHDGTHDVKYVNHDWRFLSPVDGDIISICASFVNGFSRFLLDLLPG